MLIYVSMGLESNSSIVNLLATIFEKVLLFNLVRRKDNLSVWVKLVFNFTKLTSSIYILVKFYVCMFNY